MGRKEKVGTVLLIVLLWASWLLIIPELIECRVGLPTGAEQLGWVPSFSLVSVVVIVSTIGITMATLGLVLGLRRG